LEEKIMGLPQVQDLVAGKTVIKVIPVPDKPVNIVVR